jgi:hypothetical protein
VVEAFRGAAADLDGDGNVTLAELASWVGPRVKRRATDVQRVQVPTLSTGTGIDAQDVLVAEGVRP